MSPVSHEISQLDQILKALLGITRKDLKEDEPIDLVLETAARNFAHHQALAWQYGVGISRDINGGMQHPSTLPSWTDSRNYDAAVTSMRALRETLLSAAYAYKLAHRNT